MTKAYCSKKVRGRACRKNKTCTGKQRAECYRSHDNAARIPRAS